MDDAMGNPCDFACDQCSLLNTQDTTIAKIVAKV